MKIIFSNKREICGINRQEGLFKFSFGLLMTLKLISIFLRTLQ